ncbi:MAG: hypothetical protein JNN12_13260 [Bacteroidetes Order II. Incertae sedis bacterium]|nr:hypothetical protein [Bacteroidetes Order II. bacterium]
MKNRNLFNFLIVICIITPGIYYFISGDQLGNTTLRNLLVVVQIVAGLLLLFLYGRKPDKT